MPETDFSVNSDLSQEREKRRIGEGRDKFQMLRIGRSLDQNS